MTKQAWSLLAAIGTWAKDGFHVTTREEHAERMAVCDGCDSREGWRCLECGCFIALKARARALECKRGLWPEIPKTQKDVK